MRSLPKPDNPYGYSEPYLKDVLGRKWRAFRSDMADVVTGENSRGDVVYMTADVRRWMRIQNEDRILV